MATCRFCNACVSSRYMVKYGLRHYAHFTCYLDNGKKLEDLRAWQIEQFPYNVLKDRGLLDRAAEIVAAKKAAGRI